MIVLFEQSFLHVQYGGRTSLVFVVTLVDGEAGETVLDTQPECVERKNRCKKEGISSDESVPQEVEGNSERSRKQQNQNEAKTHLWEYTWNESTQAWDFADTYA